MDGSQASSVVASRLDPCGVFDFGASGALAPFPANEVLQHHVPLSTLDVGIVGTDPVRILSVGDGFGHRLWSQGREQRNERGDFYNRGNIEPWKGRFVAPTCEKECLEGSRRLQSVEHTLAIQQEVEMTSGPSSLCLDSSPITVVYHIPR